tara:strand:- start:7006 stop:7395 length:390 start_codon:yes stop_codon:yes gene_type:complete
MGGHHVNCDQCNFEITFGHSPDTSNSMALCTNCHARYAIPTANRFGAEAGDRLELHLVTAGKKQKQDVLTATAVFFTVLASDREGCVTYPLDVVHCPECDCNSVIGHLKNGDACPICKSGYLTADFVEL